MCYAWLFTVYLDMYGLILQQCDEFDESLLVRNESVNPFPLKSSLRRAFSRSFVQVDYHLINMQDISPYASTSGRTDFELPSSENLLLLVKKQLAMKMVVLRQAKFV